MESTQTKTSSLEDEQKVIVKFLTLTEDIKPKKIHSRLAFVYKENVVLLDNVLKWCKQFRATKNVKKIRKKRENPSSGLHCAETPWRRIDVADNGDEKTTAVIKKIYSILNKVTDKNFTILIEQAESLPIDTEDCLRNIVNVILTYVCSEHKYSNLYAKLCAHLYSRKVPYNQQITDGSSTYLVFGEVLRTGCEEGLKLKLREIEGVPFESSEPLRYKLKGLNLFIAELYKIQVLPIETLHEEYLHQLFNDSNNNIYKIENFCVSLNQLGKFLEVQCNRTPSKFSKEKLDFYFTHIGSLLENKSQLPPRIYFMLLDLAELRGRNWIPRLETKIKFRVIRKFRFKKFNQNSNNKNVSKGNKNFKKVAKGEEQSEKKEVQSRDSTSETGKYPNIIKGDIIDDFKEIQYKVRSSMNKMTDGNIVYFLEQLLALSLEQYKAEIVKLITEKAIKEPLFSHLYAELCRQLCAKKSLNETAIQEGKFSFKQLLLSECDQLWNEKINDNQTYNEQNDLFRRKIISQGLAKFITELYKLGILSNDTINDYLKFLLDESKQTEKNIEFFCYFLTYIGEDLEKENREMFEKTFTTIKVLHSKTPRLPYRIWFMLLDLIELKQRNWLVRAPVLVEEIISEQDNRKTNTRGEHRFKDGQNIERLKRRSMRVKRYNQTGEQQQRQRTTRSARVAKQKSKIQQQSPANSRDINKSFDVSCLSRITAATINKENNSLVRDRRENTPENVMNLAGNISSSGEETYKAETTISEKLCVESKEKSDPPQ
ncbi:uncharacterized protein [Rhodnius prolixus]|uniref:uncharacterized protein n=1 Tax=Rhodnius prolixus TaxID=13249 RepID=UPI003D18921A